MKTDKMDKKIIVLLAIFGVLVIGKVVMFFAWEYQPLPPEMRHLPPPKVVRPAIPREKNPQETITDGLLIGRYSREVSLPLNPEVEVGYLIPVDQNEKPLPRAKNMVFYGVFNGEGKRVPCSQAWLQQLAREYKCTVFSLGINSNSSITEERDKYYIYQEAGWFDIVFDVQRKLAKRFGFPKRKLLLIGESSGGSMVQRIAAAYPDRIAAAAWCGGSRYDVEHMKKDGIPRLILNTWGCPGETASIILAKQERELGNPVLIAQMPPDPTLDKWYHHAPGPESYRLIQEYIGGMAEMLHQNNGQTPKLNAGEEFLPSTIFAASWQNRFRQIPFHEMNQVSIMQPYGTKPKLIAVVFGRTNDKSRLQMLDALYWLSRLDVIPLHISIGDNLIEEPPNAVKILDRILKEKEWRNLPIIVIGFNEAGLPGAVAALANGNPRIQKIVLYGTACDSPFPELSIIENRKLSPIPMLICNEMEGEISLANTVFRKFSITGVNNRSWKSEIEALVVRQKGTDDAGKMATAN